MSEYQHHVLTRGHYHIVALTRDQEFENDDIYAYAVMSSSGVKLRQELSLSDARNWIDDRIEQDRGSPSSPEPARARERDPVEATRTRSTLTRPGRKRR
ncbi:MULTISPECIES: hypothetical protein [unclassified Lysobacter]|uniref:hypothetical protein n=1 Tax=unclassified Lysobacter TaxID=2635362 RepID=UPI000700441B|nr:MULTISPECIES: hypothetical protein [unclassified Lysobacter]KRA20923.1 hypothetical protein ASD69_06395 [Lysobacter sp. Root604]KRD39930.1 hypothetical protein ASE35_06345 [Lysobacter sp. Root916]KRD79956.1 hypothetical protein ASE43_03440 [Lysobacter sp. Root983]